jgi:hypothetical protein
MKRLEIIIATAFIILGVSFAYFMHDIRKDNEEALFNAEIRLADLISYLEECEEANAYYEYFDVNHIMPDVYPFEHAFESAIYLYGEGSFFEWHDEQYALEYAELATTTYSSNWVLNSDDKDDNCRSNIHDECGVCDGPGAYTWFADTDNDGLGDPDNSINSCFTP